MQLSPVGVIANVLWHEIPNHVQHVTLGEFVVMPNHIHGILILNGSEMGDVKIVGTNDVGTRHALSLQNNNINKNTHPRFRKPGKNSVSTIIGGFKSAVTKHAN